MIVLVVVDCETGERIGDPAPSLAADVVLSGSREAWAYRLPSGEWAHVMADDARRMREQGLDVRLVRLEPRRR